MVDCNNQLKLNHPKHATTILLTTYVAIVIHYFKDSRDKK